MIIREVLFEGVDIRTLIERVSHTIPEVLRSYVEQTLKQWRSAQIYDHRKAHGLPDDWDPTEAGFYPDDAIGDNISKLVPIDGHSPVYGAMTMVSRALTKLVQEYVREKFGDPVQAHHGNEVIAVPVQEIRVSVWWHPKRGQSYGGVFRTRSYHANGPETLMEVIVNREFWRHWLIDAFVGEMSGEGYHFDEFSESITKTFAHEYAHLEQDLKGAQNYTFSLLPSGKAGRNSSNVNAVTGISPTDSLRYSARPAEIDAMATGAAAQVIERVMRNFQIDARRWGYTSSGWTIQKVPDEQWNAAVKEQMASGIHAIPIPEFVRYIEDINQEMAQAEPVAKAKFLQRVKVRFLRTYYKRLSSYLR